MDHTGGLALSAASHDDAPVDVDVVASAACRLACAAATWTKSVMYDAASACDHSSSPTT